VLALGDGVDRSELLSREPYRNYLHRLGAAARATASAALHLLHVVADFRLVGILLNLLLDDHAQNRMKKRRREGLSSRHLRADKEGSSLVGSGSARHPSSPARREHEGPLTVLTDTHGATRLVTGGVGGGSP